MGTALTHYHGTQWRCVYGWKDTGGVDGVQWVVDLEWEDSASNWHTDEAWAEEKRRAIPTKVLRWKVNIATLHCPRHVFSRAEMMCPTCGTTLDQMTV